VRGGAAEGGGEGGLMRGELTRRWCGRAGEQEWGGLIEGGRRHVNP
jgi:hypothetical protein